MISPPGFTDPGGIATMEAEHLPLWRAFIRVFAHLLVPGVRIMDFGCSRGGLLNLICREARTDPMTNSRSMGAGSIPVHLSLGVGIDVDAPAMRNVLADAARANRGRYPLLFTTSGPRSFPGQFDLAVSHEVVYLLEDLRRTFGDIHSSLAPGGHFCLATGCHADNPLFPRWRTSLSALGIATHDHSMEDYEAALLDSGFRRIRRDRLRLTEEEYDSWIRDRASVTPNPAWFRTSSVERRYYTRLGKMVLTAQKG